MRGKTILMFATVFLGLTQVNRQEMRSLVFNFIPETFFSTSRSSNSISNSFEALLSRHPQFSKKRSQDDDLITPLQRYATLSQDGPLTPEQVTIERFESKGSYFLRLSVAGVSISGVDQSIALVLEPNAPLQDRQLRIYDEFGNEPADKVERDARFLKLSRMADLAKTYGSSLHPTLSLDHLDFNLTALSSTAQLELEQNGYEFKVGIVDEKQSQVPVLSQNQLDTCQLGSPYLELFGVQLESNSLKGLVNRSPAGQKNLMAFKISIPSAEECLNLKSQIQQIATQLSSEMNAESILMQSDARVIPISTRALSIKIPTLSGTPLVSIASRY